MGYNTRNKFNILYNYGVSLQLTDHELMIASHLVNPYDITVSWNNIAGLSQVIDEIKETVIFPVQRKDLLRNSTLTKPPKG